MLIFRRSNAVTIQFDLATTDDVLGFLTLEDGTDRLYRNVGKELPPLAA